MRERTKRHAHHALINSTSISTISVCRNSLTPSKALSVPKNAQPSASPHEDNCESLNDIYPSCHPEQWHEGAKRLRASRRIPRMHPLPCCLKAFSQDL